MIRNTREYISEENRYDQFQKGQEESWEKACLRCGACCGVVDGDPCEHLFKTRESGYACRIYENRFGLHKTRTGRPFQCVPLRQILNQPWPGDRSCAYKKLAHFS